MKIQDLIPLNKEVDDEHYLNKTKKNFLKKNGYYFEIPSHSAEEGVLLNNYEKECVIAYIKNKYLTIFLIKTPRSYRGFVFLEEFLNNIGSYTYEISSIFENKDILKSLKQDEENLKIVNEEEYNKFNKLLLLESLEN